MIELEPKDNFFRFSSDQERDDLRYFREILGFIGKSETAFATVSLFVLYLREHNYIDNHLFVSLEAGIGMMMVVGTAAYIDTQRRMHKIEVGINNRIKKLNKNGNN